MNKIIIAGVAIGITVATLFAFTSFQMKQQVGNALYSNNLTRATTTTSVSVTTSTRLLATTTNPTDPTNSYDRVYATMCTTSTNPVFINMNQDKGASTTAAQAIIAAAAGYNSCFELTDRNHYTGSIQASSTNQTATVVTVSEYVN